MASMRVESGFFIERINGKFMKCEYDVAWECGCFTEEFGCSNQFFVYGESCAKMWLQEVEQRRRAGFDDDAPSGQYHYYAHPVKIIKSAIPCDDNVNQDHPFTILHAKEVIT